CKNVTYDNVHLFSRVVGNNDGLDIVDCWNVVVSNSFFDCGDDCICPKSDSFMGVKNLVVTNCIIKSESNGIKCGTGSIGSFTDITISNCVIYDSRFAGIALEIVDGGTMERIAVNNITMHNVNGGIFVKIGQREGEKPGTIKNISFTNIIADGIGAWRPNTQTYYHKPSEGTKIGMSIVGQPGYCVENVTLSHIYMQFAGGGTLEDVARVMEDKPKVYPEYSNFGITSAYAFNVRHVKGIQFNNVTSGSQYSFCFA
ncbi:MAG: glycosyl hydrolase family 28 protein, partial [Runella zeae]